MDSTLTADVDRAQCPICWNSIRVRDGHLAPHTAPTQPFTPIRDCTGSGRPAV